MGVDVRFNTLAEPAEVLAERPDVVVVATGGVPDLCGFDESDNRAVAERVWSVWDVLAGTAPVAPGSRVLLFDDHGAFQGPSCAEQLAAQGAIVELVTPDRSSALHVTAVLLLAGTLAARHSHSK